MALGAPAALPTLYEYYTNGGINSGLSADQSYFTLNDRNISLYSGAMHYFRIPRQYWRDRLRKLKAAGLNTVETYVPWNLHEPENGSYDFGNGGSEMQDFLDIQEYLKIAQEEDLFAIVRGGPYICAEWENGGFPSWLLREEGLRSRTSESKFIGYVKRYFGMLLPLLAALQFTNGGPIIAFQIENEYGNFGSDHDYMQQLVDIFKDQGIVELLVSSDNAKAGTKGTLPGVLFQTINFGSNAEEYLDMLKEMQPTRPFMVMEYWTGWFDYWGEGHHTKNNKTFTQFLDIILNYPASFNMYMFHGGTNWGFMNGANADTSNYNPITTSYDYDAPLSEAGDYTDKYYAVKNFIEHYNPIKTLTPELPELLPRIAYPSATIQEQLTFLDMIDRAPAVLLSNITLPMEKLFLNNESGQSYGYTVYRQEKLTLPAESVLTIEGQIRDIVMVLVNGVLVSNILTNSSDLDGFGFWRLENSELVLTSEDLTGATLDLMITNWGRGDGGGGGTNKGLTADNQVFLNGEELTSWTIYPFEFKKWWTSNLNGWRQVDGNLSVGPSLYRAILTLEEDPVDTFIDMREWGMGVVAVNGFVIGRFALLGPQQTLYLPAPLLQKGNNEIIVFEHFTPAAELKFSVDPIYETH